MGGDAYGILGMTSGMHITGQQSGYPSTNPYDAYNSALYPNLIGQYYGVRSATVGRPSRTKCAYCGNLYDQATVKMHVNCPTCGGGWSD